MNCFKSGAAWTKKGYKESMFATATSFGAAIDSFVADGGVLVTGLIGIGVISLGWKVGSRLVSKLLK